MREIKDEIRYYASIGNEVMVKMLHRKLNKIKRSLNK